MSKIQASPDVATVPAEELQKYVTLFFQDVVRVVNGGVEFGTNILGKPLSVTFSAANADVSVAHGLGKVPTGYLVTSLSASMVVYNGSTANTAANVTLRASAAGTAGIFVF